MNGIQAAGRYNELRDLVPALEIAVRDADDRRDYTASYVLTNALQLAIHERDKLHGKLAEVTL